MPGEAPFSLSRDTEREKKVCQINTMAISCSAEYYTFCRFIRVVQMMFFFYLEHTASPYHKGS